MRKLMSLIKILFFFNIYHFWRFANYLSMYYIWRWTALDCLKMNLRKKWPKNFVNVNLFIELCKRKTEMMSPVVFYGDEESYFEKILLLDKDLRKILKPHHIMKEKKKKKEKKIINVLDNFFMIFFRY